MFMRGKTRRKLTTRCGTPAYMSPEVSRSADYEGDDADLWSCCIILIILLTGSKYLDLFSSKRFYLDLPWDNSTLSCPEFVSHVKNQTNSRINSIPEGPRRIILETLKFDPTKRWKVSDIMLNPWYLQENSLLDFKFMAADPSKLIQLIRENSSTQLIS